MLAQIGLRSMAHLEPTVISIWVATGKMTAHCKIKNVHYEHADGLLNCNNTLNIHGLLLFVMVVRVEIGLIS